MKIRSKKKHYKKKEEDFKDLFMFYENGNLGISAKTGIFKKLTIEEKKVGHVPQCRKREVNRLVTQI